MWGAVIGDIVGSRFEFHNHKSKEFELFTPRNCFTDDSVMTIAVAKTLSENRGESDEVVSAQAVKNMQELGRRYPDCGFGGMFERWVMGEAHPYGSFGNGAAMRVSAAGLFGASESEVKRLSRAVTAVSHDHPEAIKGAEAVALAVYMARSGVSKHEICKRICMEYYPEIEDMSCDKIRPGNRFDVTCQGSVPQAVVCFDEARDYEDAVRNAVSIGGDSDTLAAITGSIAEAAFGIPEEIKEQAKRYLTADLLEIMNGIVY